MTTHRRRPGAEFGGTEKICRLKFLNDPFWEKFPFLPQTFLMFFLVIDYFSDFPCLFCVKCSMMTHMALSSREKPRFHKRNPSFFHSVRTFTCVRQHYFSKYWEDGCMGRAQPQFFWGEPSPNPLSLRP